MTTTSRQGWRFDLVPWIAGFITLLLNLGIRLANVPLSQLLEANLCRTYYEEYDPSRLASNGHVDERFCKKDPIQEKLAFYLGLVTTLELVCGEASFQSQMHLTYS